MEDTHGKRTDPGRTMGTHRTDTAEAKRETIPVSRTETDGSPQSAHRHHLCAQKRNPLGDASERARLRLGNELLAIPSRLAEGRRLAENPRDDACEAERSRQDRLVACDRRLKLRESGFGGAKVGPNPTDRRKAGSKHHVITDGNGIPLAVLLTGANAHDVTQLIPLVNAIPFVRGKPGHPRRKPAILVADRGYDSQPHRDELEAMGIGTLIARRNTEHGSGLGIFRWMVERTIAWLHQFRRLRVRFERRADIHEAFLSIGCAMICWNCLNQPSNSLC